MAKKLTNNVGAPVADNQNVMTGLMLVHRPLHLSRCPNRDPIDSVRAGRRSSRANDRNPIADVASGFGELVVVNEGTVFEAGLEDGVVFRDGLGELAALGDREGGFFAEDVFAVLERVDRNDGVPMVRRTDHHGVDVVARGDVAEVVVHRTVFVLIAIVHTLPSLRFLTMNAFWRFSFALIVLASAFTPLHAECELQAVQQRVEYKTNPIGIDAPQPRLSWQVAAVAPASRSLKQTAYRILVSSSVVHLQAGNGDLWDSGQVASDETLHI